MPKNAILGVRNAEYELYNQKMVLQKEIQQAYADAVNAMKKYSSASEAVINCLRPYIGTENVVVIGETTVGKNVAMEPYQDERYNFILWPVVAYVLNSAGQANYVNGITPDFTLSERNLISPLYPLGDTKEYLLKNTIAYITTGSMPDLPQTEEQVSKGKIIYNSLIRRSMNGIRLR